MPAKKSSPAPKKPSKSPASKKKSSPAPKKPAKSSATVTASNQGQTALPSVVITEAGAIQKGEPLKFQVRSNYAHSDVLTYLSRQLALSRICLESAFPMGVRYRMCYFYVVTDSELHVLILEQTDA